MAAFRASPCCQHRRWLRQRSACCLARGSCCGSKKPELPCPARSRLLGRVVPERFLRTGKAFRSKWGLGNVFFFIPYIEGLFSDFSRRQGCSFTAEEQSHKYFYLLFLGVFFPPRSSMLSSDGPQAKSVACSKLLKLHLDLVPLCIGREGMYRGRCCLL